MTVRELTEALSVLPPDLHVMAAGECAEKVIVENVGDNAYVRIFEPWDVDFVCPAKEMAAIKGERE